ATRGSRVRVPATARGLIGGLMKRRTCAACGESAPIGGTSCVRCGATLSSPEPAAEPEPTFSSDGALGGSSRPDFAPSGPVPDFGPPTWPPLPAQDGFAAGSSQPSATDMAEPAGSPAPPGQWPPPLQWDNPPAPESP